MKEALKTITCKMCGKEFVPYRERRSKFCSKKCYRHYNVRDHKQTTGINEFRIRMGLSPLEPGYVECRRCNRKFYTWDKKRDRTCYECKTREEN